MKKIFYIFNMMACCAYYQVSAQGNQPGLTTEIQSVITPSPNAASLGKFTEIPMSNYTGLPNISIPIYQVKDGDITLPVSLDYHAGGIKVDEVSSSVGLGWALSTGGVISRSTRGKPDNISTFGLFDAPKVTKWLNGLMTTTEEQDYIVGVYNGDYDAESDMYYLSVGSISCKFFIDSLGNFITMPKSANVKITHNSGGYDWVVKDGNGITYKFIDRDWNTNTTQSQTNDGGYNDAGYFSDINSWYLSEIEDTKGNKVTITYRAGVTFFQNNGAQKISIPYGGGGYPLSICQTVTTQSRAYNQNDNLTPKSIIFSDGKIVFTYDQLRTDIPGDSSLHCIEIYNKSNQLQKRYELFSTYSTGSTIGTTSVIGSPNQDKYRLRLDSLLEEPVGSPLSKPYVFTYNGTLLPYRNSYAQDHWGYGNGINNLTPLTYYINDQKLGADKRPDPSYAIASTLTAIKYPTGGTIDFEYEGNKFLTDDQTYINHESRDTTFFTFYGINGSEDVDYHTSTSFTIDSTLLGGKDTYTVRVGLVKEGYTDLCGCQIIITMTKPDGSHMFLNDGQTLVLSAGTYLVDGEITTTFPGNPIMDFTLTLTGKILKYVNGNFVEEDGPGVRIKKITKHFSSTQTEIRRYEYKLSNGTSSGLVGNLPNYEHDEEDVFADSLYYNCVCHVFSSVSNYPLVNTRSSFVGYSRVTEYFDDNGLNGKNVYTYTNYDTYNDDNASPIFPFPPIGSQDWKRGLPLNESALQYVSTNTYTPKQVKGNSYSTVTDINLHRSIKVGMFQFAHYPVVNLQNVRVLR